MLIIISVVDYITKNFNNQQIIFKLILENRLQKQCIFVPFSYTDKALPKGVPKNGHPWVCPLIIYHRVI